MDLQPEISIPIPSLDPSDTNLQSKERHHLSSGYELCFSNLNVRIEKRDILQNVYGLAKPGEMVAIMGPSGSGKTTLLNSLAGRRSIDSGTVTLNSRPLNKQMRRRISYVLQQDIFLSELTCWETLWYTALLRLPGSMPSSEKKERVLEIIDALDMRKCLHTKIGDNFHRGLSGGEKKRTTIACELLTNPALMLLDEPTSGLDSSTAYSLCSTMKKFAKMSGKTVVLTIHQPSSQIFSMFDKLLLLCEGQMAYFGEIHDCAQHFENLELPCPATYNLADHMLDQVKGSEEVKTKIIDGAIKQRKESGLSEYVGQKTAVGLKKKKSKSKLGSSNSLYTDYGSSSSIIEMEKTTTNGGTGMNGGTGLNGGVGYVNEKFVNNEDGQSINAIQFEEPEIDEDIRKYKKEYDAKWPTGFLLQFAVLTRRCFKQSWPRVFSKWTMVQLVIIGVFCGMLWFQLEPVESRIGDRQGLIFFGLIFCSFQCLLDASSSVIADRLIVSKERLAGYYRLSSYYMAKNIIDVPLVMVLPTIYFTIVFWSSGLNTQFVVFLQIICIIYLSCANANAMGSFFGTLILDVPVAMMCTTTCMLVAMIGGGFYTRNLPFWIEWFKYVSFISHVYYSAMIVDFSNNKFRCDEETSIYLSCINRTMAIFQLNDTNIDPTTPISYVSTEELINEHTMAEEGWTLQYHILMLLAYFIILKISTYIVLRYIRKPHVA